MKACPQNAEFPLLSAIVTSIPSSGLDVNTYVHGCTPYSGIVVYVWDVRVVDTSLLQPGTVKWTQDGSKNGERVSLTLCSKQAIANVKWSSPNLKSLV